MGFRRRVLPALAIIACGRIGFVAQNSGGDANDGDGDGASVPPTAHASPIATVDGTGITDISYEADGTHIVFADNNPASNGNLVIFRQGDGTTMLKVYVSTDHGATWTRYILSPAGTGVMNVMGACQDTVTHLFHLSWIDQAVVDEYARVQPTYTGGDITGFTIVAIYAYYNDGVDTPGSRDLSEIVDSDGVHRLLFSGTGSAGGNQGLYKLGVTTPSGGVAPASLGDWADATNHSNTSSNDQLLPNNYPTGDQNATFMLSVSSNLAAGTTAPAIVVAGFPVDEKLIAWTITPAANSNFTIGAVETVSTHFGAGTGTRTGASLSLVSAPSGATQIVYNEAASSPAPGLHVATFSASGALAIDSQPQPTTSTQARHAVIATDSQSRPAVLYADGAGNIVGTLYWPPAAAWLPAAQVSAAPTPDSAWSITNVWSPGGQDTFGYYRDDGAATTTTFSQVYWR
ncbi:MAG TPA: hypothetical protein VMJ10_22715 [Kofleriaceae bacterium]|nr:hypothetical protein [Kofleriaceae bacterium]